MADIELYRLDPAQGKELCQWGKAVISSRKPLTGVGLKLFRVWLYATYPGAFVTLAILTLTSPHLDRIGLGMAFLFISFAYLAFHYIRRIERKFGHGHLYVSTTLGAFMFMIGVLIVFPVMWHWMYALRSHGANSTEQFSPALLMIIAAVIPYSLLVTKWPDPKIQPPKD